MKTGCQSPAETLGPVIIPVADGSEEMETVIVVDVLRRAGLNVRLLGLSSAGPVCCSRSVMLMPDDALASPPEDGAVFVVPGGAKGVEKMRAHTPLLERIRASVRSGLPVGALCAGPLVLLDAGVLQGRRVTSYPTLAGAFDPALWTNELVVEDGPIITSQGPATAMLFALALVRRLMGPERAMAVETGLKGCSRPLQM